MKCYLLFYLQLIYLIFKVLSILLENAVSQVIVPNGDRVIHFDHLYFGFVRKCHDEK